MKTHDRVIPRDLFNEGKLLTELGHVSLAILDNFRPEIRLDHDGEPFEVWMSDDGELTVNNTECRINRTDEIIDLYTCYNARDRHPLMYRIEGDYDRSGYVFEQYEIAGQPPVFTHEFLEEIKDKSND